MQQETHDNASKTPELEAVKAERDRLATELERMKVQLRELSDESYRAHEARSALCSLLAAAELLGGALRRDLVLEAIREITANLVGSEEVAIFTRAEDGSFVRAAAFGVEAPESMPDVGPLAEAAASMTPWFSDEPGRIDDSEACTLTAAVPLAAGGEVVGMLAVYRMLMHKMEFDEIDRQLLELVGTQAGATLRALREQAGLAQGRA